MSRNSSCENYEFCLNRSAKLNEPELECEGCCSHSPEEKRPSLIEVHGCYALALLLHAPSQSRTVTQADPGWTKRNQAPGPKLGPDRPISEWRTVPTAPPGGPLPWLKRKRFDK